ALPPAAVPSDPVQQTSRPEDPRLTPVPADAKPLPVGSAMPPISPAFAVGRVRTIQESGQTPMKARILISWRTQDGMQAAQCEVQDTVENLTLVEPGPAPTATDGPPKALAMRIIHW